jgi:hypothetical protein
MNAPPVQIHTGRSAQSAKGMLGRIFALLQSLLVFEEFHFAQPLFRFLLGFIRAAKVFALFGQNFVSARHFLDHPASLCFAKRTE